MLPLGRKGMTNLYRVLKSRDVTLLTKVHILKAMVLLVVMYRCELDHEESQMLKKWFRTVVLEKKLESPLDCKENKPVNPKGNQPWIFIGRTDAEAKASQVLMVKNLPAKSQRHKKHEFNPWVGKIPWKRAWQPTPVFFPGESHGQRSLVGYSMVHTVKKELALTEAT